MQLDFGTSSHDLTEINMWKSFGKTLRRVSVTQQLSEWVYLGVDETFVGSLLSSRVGLNVLPCVVW